MGENVVDTARVPWAPPLLRWAGSKKKLLPSLLARIPNNFNRYIEPFAGSACLFFAIRPRKAVLGDINCELMGTYETICAHPRLVARAAAKWSRTSSVYYKVRSLKPEDLAPIKRAARFIYLNRNCFNGVYRVNRQGRFNVPRGTRTGAMPDEAAFYRCAVALRGAELRAGDFRECLRDVRTDDFIYLDPPYASRRRNRYGEYGYNCFDELQLPDLQEILSRIHKAGAMFLLSYCEHPAFHVLRDAWHMERLRVRRHVAGFAQHRNVVNEILVSNRSLALEG